MQLIFLFVLIFAPFCSITNAQNGESETQQPAPLYQAVVKPDRTVLRRLEQVDRLIETGRSAEAAQLLGNILENTDSAFILPEEDSNVLTLRQTVADYVIDRIRKLPQESRNSYNFHFEATAERLLEKTLTDGSLEEIAQIAQRYFPTASGAAASLLVGLSQVDRGNYAAAFLTLDKLKRLHPAIPDDVAPVLDSLFNELRHQFAEKTDPSAALIDNQSATDWLEHTGWRLPGGTPSQNIPTAAGVPLIEQNWMLPIHTRRYQEREAETLLQNVNKGEYVHIPASQPILSNNILLTRLLDEIVAVDSITGKRLWTAAKSVFQFPANAQVPPLPNFQIPLRLFFWHDRITHQLSSEADMLYGIEDHDLGLLDSQIFGRIPKFRGTINDPRYIAGNTLTARNVYTGKILWQIGKFPYVQKCIDSIFSQGKPEIDDSIFTKNEEVFKETWFLGAPLPLLGRLYIIGETDGVLQLFVLESRSGKLINRQTFAEVSSSLSANSLRRTYPLFPSASSGIIVCPTGMGLVVAIDASTLSPIWCFSYAPPADTKQPVNQMNQFRQFPGRNLDEIYMRQLFYQSGWQVPSIMISGRKVIVAPPDRAALYCLDLLSGECCWEYQTTRLNAMYTACFHNGTVFLLTPKNLTALDLNTGEDISFAGHVFNTALKPSGQGVYGGGNYFIPFTGGFLAAADLSAGTLSWQNASGTAVPPPAEPKRTAPVDDPFRRYSRRNLNFDEPGTSIFSPDLTTDNVFSKPLHFGNLAGIQGRFFSQSPLQITCFDQKEPLSQYAEKLLNADSNDPEGLLKQGRIFRAEGKEAEALESFRKSLKTQPSLEAAESLRRGLLNVLRKNFAVWQSAWPELESLSNFPEEKGIALYTKFEGMLNTGQIDSISEILEKIFALVQDRPVLIPVNEDHAIQIQQAVRSLAAEKLSKEDWGQFDTLWHELAGKTKFSLLASTPGNTEQSSAYAQKSYSPLSPYLWRSGKVSVEIVEAADQIPNRPDNPKTEVETDAIVHRLLAIAERQDTAEFDDSHVPVPLLGLPDEKLSAFNFTVRPNETELILCCNDSFGKERWRINLPMPGLFDPGRLSFGSEQIFLQGFESFLLLVQGNTITALQISDQPENPPRILWSKQTSSLLLGHQAGARTTYIGAGMPFPMNSVFISPKAVFCWDDYCVYALDIPTGEVLWVKRTPYEHGSLLGDSEHLFAAFPQVSEVWAFEPNSGRKITQGRLPEEGIHVFGTNIVSVRKQLEHANYWGIYLCDLKDMFDKQRRALLVAIFPEEPWLLPIPETLLHNRIEVNSMQTIQSGRYVSISSWATKSLQIYDLLTKQTLLPTDNKLLTFAAEKLSTEKSGTMRCDVEFVDDKFLVLYTTNTAPALNYFETYEENGTEQRRYFSEVHGVLHVGVGSGAMMLFDSAGKPCWNEPVQINNWCRLLNAPERLPVMLFAASVSDREITPNRLGNDRNLSIGLMGIDKRTGERRFRSIVSTPPGWQFYRIYSDPAEQSILFKAPNQSLHRIIKMSF